MMGRQTSDQHRLFYSFNLSERISDRHLLRRINPVVTRILAELRSKLKPYLPPEAEMLSERALAQGAPRCERRSPRHHARDYAHTRLREVPRREEEGRNALCAPEDPPSLRAHAAAGSHR